MSEIDRLTKLKEKAERIQRASDKAQGALEGIMGRLLQTFGCADLDEAQKLLEELKSKEEAAEVAFKKALEEFEEEWGESV